MSDASRDQNFVTTLLGASSVDGTTPVKVYANPVTHRLLVDIPGGSGGTVQTISIATANGLAGTSDGDPANPTLTLSTTITGVLKGNGTAISAASSSTDYAALAFKTIAVSGQSDVVADSPIDTLTLVGSGITITTNAATDTITFTGAAAALTVGTTTIASGTTTRILYDNAGVLGEYTITGTGTVVAMANGPTFIAPILGAATATSLNGLTITSTTGTFTLTNAKTIAVTNSLTLSGTDGKTLTISNSGTLAGGDAFVLAIAAGKTLTVSNTITFAGTDSTVMTFPTTSKTIAANDASNWTLGSQAIGDILTASSTTAYTRLAAVAVGQVLVSAGTGTAPAYSANPSVTTLELGAAAATDTTLSRSSAGVLAVEGVVIPSISSTNTLTNKRIQPRTASSTTSANLSPDLSSASVYFRTTQTATLTIDAPIGTPVIGEVISIYIDSAGAQTLTINATYIPFGTAFPAATTAGKTFMMVAQYNGTNWKTTWASAV